MEDSILGRVEVLGFALVEYPASKTDDTATLVGDREDDTVTETVVGLVIVIGDDQPGFFQRS